MRTSSMGTIPAESARRPGLVRALPAVTGLLALSVLIQAALAGRWFIDSDIIKVHGYLGNLSFLLGLAQVALVLLAGLPARARGALLGASALLAVLLTAQIGLGYAGRNNISAVAWHVPNGVLIFGLITAMMSLEARARRELAG